MSSFIFKPIVLASASPRRQELLRQIGVPHSVCVLDLDETPLPGEPVAQLAKRLACSKAAAGRDLNPQAAAVLGADTVVVVDGVAFGKPADKADGLRMLAALSGRRHEVLTAVALALPDGALVHALSQTQVTLRPVTPQEAHSYWESGEPAGKAGGYAIQGLGAAFIEHISGSYSGVMGLPLYETAQLLQAHGLSGEVR
jgi:septum formation protein